MEGGMEGGRESAHKRMHSVCWPYFQLPTQLEEAEKPFDVR